MTTASNLTPLGELIKALRAALDAIKELDGGDQSSATGWKSDELLAVWLKGHAAIVRAVGDLP